jgi:hypothetical protein
MLAVDALDVGRLLLVEMDRERRCMVAMGVLPGLVCVGARCLHPKQSVSNPNH